MSREPLLKSQGVALCYSEQQVNSVVLWTVGALTVGSVSQENQESWVIRLKRSQKSSGSVEDGDRTPQ